MASDGDIPVGIQETGGGDEVQSSDKTAETVSDSGGKDASNNSKTVEEPSVEQPSVEQSSVEQASKSDISDNECVTQNSTPAETVTFKVIYNKQKYDVSFPVDNTISNLKTHVETLTGVPSSMQKIMFKGLAKDECTLRDLKVTKGAKIMVVGSTLNDVLSVSKPSAKELEQEAKAASTSKEPLSTQKDHKKVLDKHGKPEDIIPGVKGVREPLPQTPLAGMYNKSGGKVRLTFKLEVDQLWIGTKERTDKIPMGSIKAVVSEAIESHEEYHILGIQLGPTEASRYWIYWVPAQYVDAIKDTILGKWQYF